MCSLCEEQMDRTKAERDPAVVAILDRLAAQGLSQLDPAVHGVDKARAVNVAYFAAIAEPRAEVASVEIVTVSSGDGVDVPVKVVLPLDMKPGTPPVFYCHGGGYTFGDLDTHDHVMRAIAAVMRKPVFGVHYRRTPEHAFPAALKDALSVAGALYSPGWIKRFGHDPSRIIGIGDSAGAHLVLTTMIALRDRGLPQFAAAGLFYGMYARREDSWSHHAYGDGSVGLSTERMRWFWEKLVGPRPTSGVPDPLHEPLDADLAGLPPLAFVAAEVDCLLDDTLDLIESAKRQGHRHSFDLVRGVPHGFLHLVNIHPPARAALEKLAAQLEAMLAAPKA